MLSLKEKIKNLSIYLSLCLWDSIVCGLPLFVGVLCLVLVLLCRLSVLSSFAIVSLGCDRLFFFHCCFAAMPLLFLLAPFLGVVGWSAVCDRGISRSYSLTL